MNHAAFSDRVAARICSTMTPDTIGTAMPMAVCRVMPARANADSDQSAANAMPRRKNDVVGATAPSGGVGKPRASRPSQLPAKDTRANTAPATTTKATFAAITWVRRGNAVSVSRMTPKRYSCPIDCAATTDASTTVIDSGIANAPSQSTDTRASWLPWSSKS